MISDGFGPASQTFARTMAQHYNSSLYGSQLPLDHYLKGTVRTFSATNLITDSAAGATAYACGFKTSNSNALGITYN